MKAAHRLVGYDRKTELETFELTIPERIFGEVRSRVSVVDWDDPDAIGCYELTNSQTREIATLVHRPNLPRGLDFFLEAYAP
jgi:hypothetical protein